MEMVRFLRTESREERREEWSRERRVSWGSRKKEEEEEKEGMGGNEMGNGMLVSWENQ